MAKLKCDVFNITSCGYSWWGSDRPNHAKAKQQPTSTNTTRMTPKVNQGASLLPPPWPRFSCRPRFRFSQRPVSGRGVVRHGLPDGGGHSHVPRVAERGAERKPAPVWGTLRKREKNKKQNKRRTEMVILGGTALRKPRLTRELSKAEMWVPGSLKVPRALQQTSWLG